MTARARRGFLVVLLLAVVAGVTAPLDAQTEFRRLQHILRIGQDLHVDAQSDVREVVVVLGNLTLEGHVASDVYVWLGDVRLAPTAVIDRSLIVVAGTATIERGAIVGDDLAVVGGSLQAPADFAPGGDHALVGAPALGQGARAVVPWVTRGLLLGRLVVFDVPWVRFVAIVFFVLALFLTLVFGQAVRASEAVIVDRPLRTFLAGVLVLIVTGPLLVIFAATVVGLIVLPVVLFALLVAWTLGKVGVARAIGHRLIPEGDPDSRLVSLRSVAIGAALILLSYAVPVLGIVVWSLVGVFGLGAATIAVAASLRREYPRRVKSKAASEPQPPPAPPGPAGAPLATPGSSYGPAPDDVSSPGTPAGTPSPGPALTADLGGQPRAAFLERAAAFALDCVLVGIIDRLIDSRVDGMFFILLIGYHVGFWIWQSTTVGGIVVGLRVVRTDGAPLQPVDAVVRGLSSIFSIAALGIGCFWMLRDPERQTWHDKTAGTWVIRVPRGWPVGQEFDAPHRTV